VKNRKLVRFASLLLVDGEQCARLGCMRVQLAESIPQSCSVLQCVAVCCSMLQCVAVCYSVLWCLAVRCSICSVLVSHQSYQYLISHIF